MKIIAVTGGIGSGKSTVSGMFGKLGADVISCDEISRRIMLCGGSAYNEIIGEFGDGILNDENEIDRRALADIVFSDEKKLEKLNSITHRLIYEEAEKLINKSEAAVVCVEIPLLFTTETTLKLDAKIVVTAPVETRIGRVTERDNMTRDEVLARISNQMTDDEMRKRADYVIENNGDTEALRTRVEELYNIFV